MLQSVVQCASCHTSSHDAAIAECVPRLCYVLCIHSGALYHWRQPILLILGSRNPLQGTAVRWWMNCHWLLSCDQVFHFSCGNQELLEDTMLMPHLARPSNPLPDDFLPLSIPTLSSEDMRRLLSAFPSEIRHYVCRVFYNLWRFSYCLL